MYFIEHLDKMVQPRTIVKEMAFCVEIYLHCRSLKITSSCMDSVFVFQLSRREESHEV